MQGPLCDPLQMRLTRSWGRMHSGCSPMARPQVPAPSIDTLVTCGKPGELIHTPQASPMSGARLTQSCFLAMSGRPLHTPLTFAPLWKHAWYAPGLPCLHSCAACVLPSLHLAAGNTCCSVQAVTGIKTACLCCRASRYHPPHHLVWHLQVEWQLQTHMGHSKIAAQHRGKYHSTYTRADRDHRQGVVAVMQQV